MGRQLLVLIVEDQAMVAMGLSRTLEGLGCSVVGPVGSVRDAYAAMDGGGSEGLDLALVDAALPDGDGVELGRALAARGVRCAIVSGYPQPSDWDRRSEGMAWLNKLRAEEGIRREVEAARGAAAG